MTTELDIKALRALYDAAPPGEWKASEDAVKDAHGMWIADCFYGDATLIATMHNTYAALLDGYEAAFDALERLCSEPHPRCASGYRSGYRCGRCDWCVAENVLLKYRNYPNERDEDADRYYPRRGGDEDAD